ncbi:YdeI/OmpD-associated family protein [Lysobacter soli]|nr:YdeI/OmpD-associated family protein [Lysobacter soli]MDG2518325.1 YdeI/OmpD-associated family protein [Lysobacter soli]
MDVPPEFAAALAKNAKARKAFEALDRTNRYAFCWRVHTAKKAETKAARVEKFVAMLLRGEKIHG